MPYTLGKGISEKNFASVLPETPIWYAFGLKRDVLREFK